jgi:hypothetical protein
MSAVAAPRCNSANLATASAGASGNQMSARTREPSPQCARTIDRTERLTGSGARSSPLAQLPYTSSAATASGWRAACAAATCPPSHDPSRA